MDLRTILIGYRAFDREQTVFDMLRGVDIPHYGRVLPASRDAVIAAILDHERSFTTGKGNVLTTRDIRGYERTAVRTREGRERWRAERGYEDYDMAEGLKRLEEWMAGDAEGH